jgi:hypothetical protein
MHALKRLDRQARRLEGLTNGPSLESFIVVERAASPTLDGRSYLAGKAIWRKGPVGNENKTG